MSPDFPGFFPDFQDTSSEAEIARSLVESYAILMAEVARQVGVSMSAVSKALAKEFNLVNNVPYSPRVDSPFKSDPDFRSSYLLPCRPL